MVRGVSKKFLYYLEVQYKHKEFAFHKALHFHFVKCNISCINGQKFINIAFLVLEVSYLKQM